jgi:hypothetical protein
MDLYYSNLYVVHALIPSIWWLLKQWVSTKRRTDREKGTRHSPVTAHQESSSKEVPGFP